MKHFDLSEVSLSYVSKTTGQTIDYSTTHIDIPEPDHRYDVTMGDRHVRFTAVEAFEAIARLLEDE